MAKYTSQMVSNRGTLNNGQHKLRSNIKPRQTEKPQKPKKQGFKTEASIGDTETGTENDDDDSDGSEDHADSQADEPDASALSDAQKWAGTNTEWRLAGLEANDMTINDDEESHATFTAAMEAGDSNDDDDYADVEDVSDDEESLADEDDHKARQAAEKDLIEEFERTEGQRNANAMTTELSDMLLQETDPVETSFFEFHTAGIERDLSINFNDDPFCGLNTQDSLYQLMAEDAENALATWRMPEGAGSQQNGADSTTIKKRVRFEETQSPSSSTHSTEDANESFPDLFASQDDPLVKQCLAVDLDPDASFQLDDDEAASYYDFDDEERLALEIDEFSETDSDATDLDTEDEGETTDEETEEEQLERIREMQKARARVSSSSPTPPAPAKRPVSTLARGNVTSVTATPNAGRRPRMGTFSVDPTRATISTDASGKQLKIYPPSKPLEKEKPFWDRMRDVASHDGSPKSSVCFSTRRSSGGGTPQRPLTAQSTLGSMFDGNLDILRDNDVSGIARDFYYPPVPRPQASFTSTSFTEDSEEETRDIDMQDFIDMDGVASDSDELLSASMTMPTDQEVLDSYTIAGAPRNDNAVGLPHHLEQQRGLVGSFRQNQNHAKHLSSLASHPAKRASTSEYNAIQKGKRNAANTPITPARKSRVSQDLTLTGAGVKKVVSSPLSDRRPRSRGSSISVALQQTLSLSPILR